MAKQKSSKSSNGATVGYEQQLWQMADALRGSMDSRLRHGDTQFMGIAVFAHWSSPLRNWSK